MDSTIMSALTISQYAAIGALQNGENVVAEMVGKYNERRKLVVST
jgi:aspartate/methionine/tyrosine aminotransferase